MAAWREDPVLLTTERLRIRAPEAGDAKLFADYYRANGEHLAPWEPPRPDTYTSIEYWTRGVVRMREERRAGKALVLFWESLSHPKGVIGVCRFSNIVRGAFLACNLGYSVHVDHQGQGYMTEALGRACRFVFEEIGLHRIMANYIPSNEPSAKLLKRLGFVEEGLAKDYLFINGGWRDHVLTSLTNPESVTPDPV